MQERDPSVTEVVRRERRDAGGRASARDRGSQTVRRNSQEDNGHAYAVVSRKNVQHGSEERLGYGDPACAAGLRDRLRDAALLSPERRVQRLLQAQRKAARTL